MLDGSARPTGYKPPATYSHAQKMRAAMTYMFGAVIGLGLANWHSVDTADGSVLMRGNPSVSQGVSSFMMSLRRRKTQYGESTQSARAVGAVCAPRSSMSGSLIEIWIAGCHDGVV